MQSGNIVGYLRVSTSGQVQNGEGLEIQRNKILSYCKERNLTLAKFYEDRGISGAIRERPALLQLLKDCEAKKVHRVIIYKQDRLSRELGVMLWLEGQFQKYEIEVNTVEEPEFDIGDPIGKALRRIIGVFAELERDVITCRLKDGRENRAKNGKRGSGPIPFGYSKVGDSLEINQNEGMWVQKIFRWFIKGRSYTEIIRRLDRSGVRSKRGKQFSIEALKYILANAVYCGESVFGNVRVIGKHKAIVSGRLFFKVQRALKKV